MLIQIVTLRLPLMPSVPSNFTTPFILGVSRAQVVQPHAHDDRREGQKHRPSSR